jgi:hypothetical protein
MKNNYTKQLCAVTERILPDDRLNEESENNDYD